MRAASYCRRYAATCSGVRPLPSRTSRFAPPAMSRSISGTFPAAAAACSPVYARTSDSVGGICASAWALAEAISATPSWKLPKRGRYGTRESPFGGSANHSRCARLLDHRIELLVVQAARQRVDHRQRVGVDAAARRDARQRVAEVAGVGVHRMRLLVLRAAPDLDYRH